MDGVRSGCPVTVVGAHTRAGFDVFNPVQKTTDNENAVALNKGPP